MDEPAHNHAAFISLVTILVSGANYGFSLAAVRLLPARAYGQFASAQGLLLVLGTGCMAAIPWAITKYISRNPTDPRAPTAALSFGVVAAAFQGAVLAAVAGVVLGSIGGVGLGLATAAAAFALSMVAAPLGLLQGLNRIDTIGVLRLLEAAVRIGSGLLLLLYAGRQPGLAITGFVLGSTALFTASLLCTRVAFRLRRGDAPVFRALLRSALTLGAVQIVVAMLSSLDTIGIQFAGLSVGTIAAYQVASLIGRIPTYLSATLSFAYFQPLTRADPARGGQILSGVASLYLVASVVLLLVIPTVPTVVMAELIPDGAETVLRLLWFTTVSGVLIGFADLFATAHQAHGRILRALAILGPGALIQLPVLVIAGRTFGVVGYAIALAGLSALIALAVLLDLRRWMPGFTVSRVGLALLVTSAGVSYVVSRVGPVHRHWQLYDWAVLVVVLGPVALRRFLRRGPQR